jgi:hypothetical protein
MSSIVRSLRSAEFCKDKQRWEFFLEEGWARGDAQKSVADGTCKVVAFVPAPGEEKVGDRKAAGVDGQADGVAFAEVGKVYVIAVESGFAGVYGEEDANRELPEGLLKGAA